MANYYIQDGKSIDYTPSSAVTAGDVIALENGKIGIAKFDIAASKLGSLAIEGVFALPLTASTALDLGQEVAWNSTTGKVTEATALDNPCGFAVKAAESGDATVWVKLWPECKVKALGGVALLEGDAVTATLADLSKGAVVVNHTTDSTLTLPLLTTAENGLSFVVYPNVGAGALTIAGAATVTVDPITGTTAITGEAIGYTWDFATLSYEVIYDTSSDS